MEGLNNYRDKLQSIEKLVNKMESGELSIHELVELETLTRELHERSIILKYKAFEGTVEKVTPPVVEAEVIEDKVEEIIEVEVEEPEPEVEEKPVMDFSMFDEPKVEAEKPVEVVEKEEKVIEPVVEKTPEPIIEKKPEPVVEKIPEPVVEKQPEPEVIAEPEPTPEEPIVVVKEKGTSFLDRLSIVDNSISAQFGGRKIETLSGAFGINERLHYINDLFDGSGEAFSDAVKSLDSQKSLDEASDVVEELAFKNSWNPEEEVVLEFLTIIKRRYA